MFPDVIEFLNEHLYSAFPARLTTGVVVWFVNLKRADGEGMHHGEGPDFASALRAARAERYGAGE